MEEMTAVNERAPDYIAHSEFTHSCFYTGFNGPTDLGCAHVVHAHSSDPLTLSEATKHPDWPKWEAAIKEELRSLEAFSTFEVVDLPPGKRPVGYKYVF